MSIRPLITFVLSDGSVVRQHDLSRVPSNVHLAAIPHEFAPHKLEQFGSFVAVSTPFFESSLWLGAAPGTLEVFDPPRQSLSATSDAIYLGRSAEKHDGWLLQVLPPNGRTSRHHHKRKRERFISLVGDGRLGTAHYQNALDVVVEPNTPHHMRAALEPALTLLIIQWVDPTAENGNNPLCMEDHHYEPHPLWV